MAAPNAYLRTTFDSSGDQTAQAASTVGSFLYLLEVSNPNPAVAFMQLFDLPAASVTVGTTVPKLSFFVPANGAFDRTFTVPIRFERAITYACTTTATGNTATATALVVNLAYT